MALVTLAADESIECVRLIPACSGPVRVRRANPRTSSCIASRRGAPRGHGVLSLAADGSTEVIIARTLKDETAGPPLQPRGTIWPLKTAKAGRNVSVNVLALVPMTL
jgi:hypothetical protein